MMHDRGADVATQCIIEECALLMMVCYIKWVKSLLLNYLIHQTKSYSCNTRNVNKLLPDCCVTVHKYGDNDNGDDDNA